MVTTIELDGEVVTFDPSIAQGFGNAIAAGDPRDARVVNAKLPRVEYKSYGTVLHGRRCPVCWVPLTDPTDEYGRYKPGPRKRYCGKRCGLWAWRRDGDPDGPLNRAKAR